MHPAHSDEMQKTAAADLYRLSCLDRSMSMPSIGMQLSICHATLQTHPASQYTKGTYDTECTQLTEMRCGDASGGFLSIELPILIDVDAKHRNTAVNIPCYAAYSSSVAVYEEYL
jgi:hypothetical protein